MVLCDGGIMKKRVVFVTFMVVFGMLLMLNIATAKIKCEEKIKGGGSSGDKYLECEGGSIIEEVFGTEYIQDQNGTVFIQVLDNNNEPFNYTILCELKVWYPNKTLASDVGLFSLAGSNNTIFYRDYAPIFNTTGVYITSATCSTPMFFNSTLKYLRFNVTINSYFIDYSRGNSEVDLSISAGTTFACSPLFIETINLMNYVEYVNVTSFWEGKGAAGINSDVKVNLYKFYSNTQTYDLIETDIINNINLNATRSTIINNFEPRVFLDVNNEKLAVDLCVRRVSGGVVGYDLYFNSNTTGSNSSLLKTTLNKNVSIGFQEVKGSGEIHVSKKEELLGGQGNVNLIWIIVLIVIGLTILGGLYYAR
jgi:hypothetical protein